MSETILFFGSGPVAARSLELLAQDFTVEAVVTKPRPAHHREAFPVLATAERLGLKTFTAETSAQLSELFGPRPVNSHVGLVIDYGIVIKPDVIDYFPYGIVNSHFSLLPRWRGADPISFAILSGDQQTGVSLMLINDKLDEGPLLAQAPYDLSPTITTPELTEKLIRLSHETLQEIIPKYLTGAIKPFEQSSLPIEPTYSRKLTKEDSILDFAKPAEQLEREVRAFAGWPRSRTTLGSVDVVITQAHVVHGSGQPGQLWLAKQQIGVYTAEDILAIDRLIPAGKPEMSAAAFLAGYQLS